MPRIRTIKPEFWSSPNLPPDPWARLLFQAMWNWADDEGRGTANPRELMGFAFPNDEWMTLDYFRRLLGGVRRAFGVKFYMVAGRPYYEIPSWDNHQKIDKRSQSRHPAPDAGEDFDPDPDQHKQESSGEPPESPPNPRRTPGAGTRNLEVGTGELTKPTVSRTPTAQTLIGEWLDHCDGPVPNRVRGQVAKLLGELLGEGIPYATVRNGLGQWHNARKHPATLPSFVHEASQGPAQRQGSSNMAAHLALVEQLPTDEYRTGEIA